MVERLAASERALRKGLEELFHVLQRIVQVSAEYGRFSGVMRWSRESIMTTGMPSCRASAAERCVSGLTSLFTKLRLQIERLDPPCEP